MEFILYHKIFYFIPIIYLFLLQKIMEDNNRRHWTVAIFLQLGIRLRYLYESRFGFRPLFTPLTDYSSPWRPKECPKYDFFTQVDHLIFYNLQYFLHN